MVKFKLSSFNLILKNNILKLNTYVISYVPIYNFICRRLLPIELVSYPVLIRALLDCLVHKYR